MHRTEQDGATLDNKYTEGNPNLAIPATVVGAPEMNSIQEELCNLVTSFGLTLLTTSTDTFDQVQAAVKEAILRGGRLAPLAPAIANNQATFADVVGFPVIDRTVVATVEFLYRIFRRTDSSNVMEAGRAFISWNTETSSWQVTRLGAHDDDAGLQFQMTLVSGNNWKLQYKSDNMAGASYSGVLSITDIKNIRF